DHLRRQAGELTGYLADHACNGRLLVVGGDHHRHRGADTGGMRLEEIGDWTPFPRRQPPQLGRDPDGVRSDGAHRPPPPPAGLEPGSATAGPHPPPRTTIPIRNAPVECRLI